MLNKSKWKGGTLQIETAKESFLHRCSSNILTTLVSVDVEVKGHVKPFETDCLWVRLAQEQQAVANQDLQQAAADDGRQNLLDSLSKAGIDNFTMKAAVPGTEVPGHKVQSLFGPV